MAEGSDVSEDRLLNVLTTEHSTLQSARIAANSEASGRVLIFLSTLSNSTIALAFAGQASDFGTPFYTFALILLPAMLVIGFATYMRVVQNLLNEAYCGFAISRIRAHYKTLHPDAEALLVLPTSAGLGAVRTEAALEKRVPRLQSLFMVSGMVAFVEALVAGAFVGLLINRAFDDAAVWAVTAGTVTFIAVLAALVLYGRRYVWDALAKLGLSAPWKRQSSVSVP
ncbi:MAG TPA: hypothetical protein VG408_05080 [Actinomycetota bacterium]|nr:hypothetical protein [Actinomycetota bacterium]